MARIIYGKKSLHVLLKELVQNKGNPLDPYFVLLPGRDL